MNFTPCNPHSSLFILHSSFTPILHFIDVSCFGGEGGEIVVAVTGGFHVGGSCNGDRDGGAKLTWRTDDGENLG